MISIMHLMIATMKRLIMDGLRHKKKLAYQFHVLKLLNILNFKWIDPKEAFKAFLPQKLMATPTYYHVRRR